MGSHYTAIKAAQALNFLLSTASADHKSVDGNQYLKLLKLLWAADRLSLRSFGRAVTDDNYSALPYGPVASKTYSLIKECGSTTPVNTTWVSQEDGQLWRELFEKPTGYSLQSIADIGDDHLAPADIMALEDAYKLFRTTPKFTLANEISHEYPEWVRARERNPQLRAEAIEIIDFFDDPATEDLYFNVDAEVLKAARDHYTEREGLAKSLGFIR